MKRKLFGIIVAFVFVLGAGAPKVYAQACIPEIPETCVIPGCTDPDASNYNPSATINDGSCVFPTGASGPTGPTGCDGECPDVDQCPNLDGVQETIPPGYYYSQEFQECRQDVCNNIDGDQTEPPGGYGVNSDYMCFPICTENSDEICLTPTPTPTDVPPPPPPQNNGGPGDGRSDGGSSCPSCTAPPPSTGGSVLGASTDVLAATGSNSIGLRLLMATSVSLTSLALGLRLTLKKNEN